MPTKLGIGICGNPEMACHTTKAALTAWGGGLIIVALGSQFIEKLTNESTDLK
jgi:hypothetical protein